MQGALDGLTVVENTLHLAGPYCGRFLSEMGAEVIKVEPLIGEANRRSQPIKKGSSILYSYYNVNKMSIALDLKKPAGKKVFLDLIRKADIFITNYRPGTMDKLGLGYEVQREVNPRLIYASITGFGESGTHSDLAGFDPLVQAMSGLMDSNSCSDGNPKVNSMSLDYASATAASVAILGALYYREKSGKGQRIDISMQDVGVIYAMPAYGFYISGMKYRQGNRSRVFAPYNMYHASDGKVMIAIGENERWEAFLRAIGRADLVGNPMFSSTIERVNNYDQVDAIVSEWAKVNTVETVLDIVRKTGGAASVVRTIDEAMNDQNVIQRNMIVRMDDGDDCNLDVAGSPFKMTETPGKVIRRAPHLGEHTKYILDKVLCYSEKEIDFLLKGNVVSISK